MKKLMMLAAGAVGYVLGTRAGRERYEQIKTQAQRFKNDPRVQAKAREAGDKVTEAAGSAKSAAQDKMSSGGDSDTTTPTPATTTPPVTSSTYPPA